MPEIQINDIGDKVVMVYSMPRVTWSANFRCAVQIASVLGIRMRDYASAYWSLSLERELTHLVKSDFEYALTVDNDSVFDPKNVLHLYALMKANPSIDALTAMQAKRGSNEMLLARKGADGKIEKTMNGVDLVSGMFKATQAHFGLTLIRLSSLRDIPQPWFLRVPDPENPGKSIDDDIYFWHQWEKAGKSLYVDWYNSIGHIEETITWVNDKMERVSQRWSEYMTAGRPESILSIDADVKESA